MCKVASQCSLSLCDLATLAVPSPRQVPISPGMLRGQGRLHDRGLDPPRASAVERVGNDVVPEPLPAPL